MLPAIAAGVALLGTGLYLRGEKQREFDVYNALFGKPTAPPAPPAPPPDALSDPRKIYEWGTTGLWQQIRKDWDKWKLKALPTPSPPQSEDSQAALWIAGGLAGAALLIFLVKR